MKSKFMQCKNTKNFIVPFTSGLILQIDRCLNVAGYVQSLTMDWLLQCLYYQPSETTSTSSKKRNISSFNAWKDRVPPIVGGPQDVENSHFKCVPLFLVILSPEEMSEWTESRSFLTTLEYMNICWSNSISNSSVFSFKCIKCRS